MQRRVGAEMYRRRHCADRVSICTETQPAKLVKAIEPVLNKLGGLCVVSEAQSVIH